jgi:hypothetical protein
MATLVHSCAKACLFPNKTWFATVRLILPPVLPSELPDSSSSLCFQVAICILHDLNSLSLLPSDCLCDHIHGDSS